MKIGVLAFISEDMANPASIARKCEQLGFDSFFVPEHPIIPVHYKTAYPRSSDGKLPEVYAHLVDPFVALSLAAAATSTIKLGTGICLVPEREPIVLAKQIATLDHYSGGRFIFGIGGGWLKEETEAMGAEFRRRWPMAREYIRAMKELWTRDDASFDGEFIKFPPVRSYPKPQQKPHPPVVVGASGERAMRNTVAVGDGWGPIALSADELAEQMKTFRKLCEEAGRDFSAMEISLFMPVSDKDGRSAARDYEQAGAHRVVLFAPPLVPDKWESELENMARAWL